MIITKDIDFSQGLTEEQLKMLEDVEAAPDDDSPDLTDEQLIRFSQAVRELGINRQLTKKGRNDENRRSFDSEEIC